MKILKEKDIRKLKRKQEVKTVQGGELKKVVPLKQSDKPIAPESRQAQALERIAAEIMLLLKASDKNADILVNMVEKIQTPEVKPVTGWRYNVVRDKAGFIKTIHAEAT